MATCVRCTKIPKTKKYLKLLGNENIHLLLEYIYRDYYFYRTIYKSKDEYKILETNHNKQSNTIRTTQSLKYTFKSIDTLIMLLKENEYYLVEVFILIYKENECIDKKSLFWRISNINYE